MKFFENGANECGLLKCVRRVQHVDQGGIEVGVMVFGR